MTGRPLIVDILVDRKTLPEKEVPKLLVHQTKNNLTIEEALISSNISTEDDIAKAYAEYFQVPLMPGEELAKLVGSAYDLAKLLPERFSRANKVVPIKKDGETLQVVLVNPGEIFVIQEIYLYTGLKVSVQVSVISAIQAALGNLYGERDEVKELASRLGSAGEQSSFDTEEDVLDLSEAIPATRETQVVLFVNKMLETSLQQRASDIHIEPYAEELRIRFRVDGILNEVPPPPRNMYVPLISRLKILSKLDIAEKRVPQDGAFTMKYENNKIDVRVSTCPTVYGEKMVMRILNKAKLPLDFEKLGFEKQQLEAFIKGINCPNGLIYVTGPTGSGKSTTLYTALQMLNSPEKNIMTVEDPVEYKFHGINQVHVKPKVGLTFAAALRSFLRQDPDIIMLGETRDAETAEICLRAALTGHLVLSTLHTNDALSAITRLEDMGIEPFLLSSSLRVVEAQRLVRRLCPNCKQQYAPTPEMIQKYGFKESDILYTHVGCEACNGLGYKGRVGIYEVVFISPTLADMIQRREPLPALQSQARKEGAKLLFESGLEKARQGHTSLEEVVTVSTGEE
ncbi:MAG: Flp pilus assembly complex ATPase component TadA [Elusimicrobia bacterium]|nr:Flp pilus assembly complex ATPase component TadA [Elusimicrobiota bacterium]